MRYEAVNAMLLNEFLKEHGKVEEGRKERELEATIAGQQKEIETLTAGLKKQASQIERGSAQLEASKPAPRLVVNNR